ncbi:MAG: hypothetical protein LQ346_007836 [Caloplaca aetnensis]|nr:MAG: hypothetical protein LQ346_007836 [Caloplaca aetnensis]
MPVTTRSKSAKKPSQPQQAAEEEQHPPAKPTIKTTKKRPRGQETSAPPEADTSRAKKPKKNTAKSGDKKKTTNKKKEQPAGTGGLISKKAKKGDQAPPPDEEEPQPQPSQETGPPLAEAPETAAEAADAATDAPVEKDESQNKGKEPAGLPTDIQRIAPEANSKYPSPYAVLTREDFDFGKADTSLALTGAYLTLRAHRQRVQQQRPGLVWKEDVAYAVWYRHGDLKAPATAEPMYTRPVCMETWIESHGQISWDDLVSDSHDTKKGIANTPQAGSRRAMEVYRDGDGDAGFFFSWHDAQKQVKVNGKPCLSGNAGGVLVGPLPNFAIIEIEETAIFWFRNKEALDYVPPDIVARRKDAAVDKAAHAPAESKDGDERAAVADKDEAEKGRSIGEAERREWRKTWGDLWRANIKSHEEACQEDGSDQLHYRINEHVDLYDIQVVTAIGCLWRTVADELDRPFAFHDANGYALARGPMILENGKREKILAAVYGPQSDLLIPMQFDLEEMSPPNSATFEDELEAKKRSAGHKQMVEDRKKRKREAGLGGHILFAVAHAAEGNQVHVKIMDSAPGYVKDDRISARISKTARKIGWFGMDTEGHPVEVEHYPEVVADKSIVVPRQEGKNACGMYSILNAWMVLLDLPMVNQNNRLYYAERPAPQFDATYFLDNALRMINCALAGHMTLDTIQAFMNWYGYCQLQDPNDSKARLAPCPTVKLDPAGLAEILDGERAVMRVMYGRDVDPRDYRLSDIRYVRDQTGCGHSEILGLLELCHEDAERAVALHYVRGRRADASDDEILEYLQLCDGDADWAIELMM